MSKPGQKIPDPGELGRLYALLAYFPGLCFMALFNKNSNEFAIKHGKQGLLLFIVEIIALLFLVDTISRLFWIIVLVACVILAFVGIYYALMGREWKVPYFGNIFEKYDL